MPNYTISISTLQEQGLVYKATQTGKTKGQIFQDFVMDGLIMAWVREMLDSDIGAIKAVWNSLTDVQKAQIKAIAGV